MLDPEVGIPIGGGWTALIEAKSNVRDTTVVSLQTHNVVNADLIGYLLRAFGHTPLTASDTVSR